MQLRQRELALAALAVLAVLAPVSGAATAKPKPKPKPPPIGSLREIACVTDAGTATAGCGRAVGLANAAYLALSPDGRNLYATARDSDAIAIFARNARTGAIKQLPGAAGCIRDAKAGADPACPVAAPGLDRASGVTVSSDGRFVYVAAAYGNAVTTFSRNASTGALTPAGCIADLGTPTQGCVAGKGLRGASFVKLAPDARTLYVASVDSNAIAGFTRNTSTGALTELGCLSDSGSGHDRNCNNAVGLDQASSIAITRDGRSLYVTGRSDSAVVAFKRDPSNGIVNGVGCVSGDAGYRRDARCDPGRGIQYAQYVTTSPDDRFVYVSATDSHTIGIFSRNRSTSELTQLPGKGGCLHDIGYATRSPCRLATGIALPLALTITRNGKFAYLAGFGYGEVTAYARNVRSGQLNQIGKCISDSDPRCPGGKALARAGFLALSPDERFVYVNAPSANAIAVFARRLK
jgi:6-phosphogluconolactonase (cycloisomerase 2 family)